jgi:hypothetical protein
LTMARRHPYRGGMTTFRGARPALVLLALVVPTACDGGPGEEGDARSVQIPAEALVIFEPIDLLGGVADLLPGADGSVWVLNSTEPFVLEFDSTGVLRAAWGRRGGGPGELQRPVSLIGRPGGADAWLFDQGRHALIPLGGQEEGGGEEGVVRLPRDSLPWSRLVSFDDLAMAGARPWIRPWEGGFLLARSRPGFELGLGVWSAQILHLDPRTPVLPVVADPEMVLGDPARRFPGVLYIIPIPLWDVCPDGRLALYDPLRNEVVRMSGREEAQAPVSLPPERRLEATRERVFAMVYRDALSQTPDLGRADSLAIRAGFEADYRELGPQISPVFPEYVDLQCDDRDVAWLQRFDLEGWETGRGPTWLRIQLDAPPLEVRLPGGLRRVRFAEGRVWGIALDPMDVPSPAWAWVP